MSKLALNNYLNLPYFREEFFETLEKFNWKFLFIIYRKMSVMLKWEALQAPLNKVGTNTVL